MLSWFNKEYKQGKKLFINILKKSFFLLVANVISKILLFGINLLAARVLNLNSFGQFTTIRSTIFLFENVLNKSFGLTAIKKISSYEINDPKATQNLIGPLLIINSVICVFIVLIISINSNWIVEKFLTGDFSIKKTMLLSTGILVASSFSSLVQSFLIGFEKYKQITITNIITSILLIPIVYLLVNHLRLTGAVLSVIIFYSFDFFAKGIILKQELSGLNLSFKISKLIPPLIDIFYFSSPVILSTIINGLTFWYAKIHLINHENSFENIAIFDAAYQWLTIIMIITAATTTVALPILSNAANKSEFKNVFRYNVLINLGISISISGLFILFSNSIMSLYGEAYITGANILIIMSITSVFFTTATLYNRYMISINKPNTLLICSIIGGGIMIIAYHILGHNTYSLAIAHLLYYVVSVVYYIIVKKLKKT